RMVARHAYVIYVLANWPESRSTHWRALLQARAIENQCFVAGVNRTGTDGNGIKYSGGSVIFNPLGEIVVSGGSGEEIIY
ncbi:MAG: carbon-nitrogen family hydrolase, partial [candidate division Zixibacteria bacterium]|nr:carbon-nitrogen family hydrolase [Gammaproteobacteria bacterium]NIV08996.1 carbon-nitrogen family hydrolase [candidate division Zixibacteria bacterium]NIX59287.1 carbon-nitrogen family hydrolase [candidate division Zixibacteria bacterium]